MKKAIIKVPAYKTMKHASEQTQFAQRMSSRYFVNKKKENKMSFGKLFAKRYSN